MAPAPKSPSPARLIRDPCTCPELRTYCESLAYDVPHEGCLACATWARGYVLVDSVVRYRRIEGEVLSIGRQVPLQWLTRRPEPNVSPNSHTPDPAAVINLTAKPLTLSLVRKHRRLQLKRGD